MGMAGIVGKSGQTDQDVACESSLQSALVGLDWDIDFAFSIPNHCDS